MRREAGLDERPNVLFQRRVGAKARAEDDERLDRFRSELVRHADHRGQRHRRVLAQAVLDLAGPDAVAGGGDHVVVSTDKPQISVVILATQIAHHQPVADELGLGRLGLTPVLEHHHRIGPMDGDLADGLHR